MDLGLIFSGRQIRFLPGATKAPQPGRAALHRQRQQQRDPRRGHVARALDHLPIPRDQRDRAVPRDREEEPPRTRGPVQDDGEHRGLDDRARPPLGPGRRLLPGQGGPLRAADQPRAAGNPRALQERVRHGQEEEELPVAAVRLPQPDPPALRRPLLRPLRERPPDRLRHRHPRQGLRHPVPVFDLDRRPQRRSGRRGRVPPRRRQRLRQRADRERRGRRLVRDSRRPTRWSPIRASPTIGCCSTSREAR